MLKKEEIRENLRKQGYTNKLINYQEFLELYKPYRDEASEIEFAEVLGISYGNYGNIKNRGTRTKILKAESKIPRKRREEIRGDLRERGYTNKLINYQEFLELYKSYKNEMEEIDFAGVLGISYSSYEKIRNSDTRTKVLKEESKITEERKEKIREDLRKRGYSNRLINYQEFLDLYEPYKNEMEEKNFAEVLGISYGNYGNMKNKGTRAKILKEESKIPEERKEEIREELRKIGYSNRLINYQEFLELYEPYRNEMQEIDFAKVLGISYSNYMAIKNRGTRAEILKEESKISEERKEEIREELRKRGYSNRLINYQEFLELYELYKNEMKEKDFAEVLGISYSNYEKIKNSGARTTILKEESEIPEERKEEIREELRKRGYSNRLIDYQEFLELYKPYENEMKEIDFAEVLGIPYSNYKGIKNGGQRAKINFSYKRLRSIKYKLSLDIREYKREELEQLCEEYGVTLEELLLDIFPNTVIEIFIHKEKIYIGRCKIPEDFLNMHSEELLHMSQELSKIIGRKYNFKSDIEDVASDSLIYVIERRGDIVRNIETENEALELIKNYMSKVIKYKYIDKCKVKGRLSLDESITSDGTTTRYDVIKSPQKTEIDDNEIEETSDDEKEEIEESIAEDMRMCYEDGMKSSDAIAYIRDKYGISKEKLLRILEQELSKKRRIVRASTGEVYLGEEL